jgi:hypothetical protein
MIRASQGVAVVGPGMDMNHGCPGLDAFFGFNSESFDSMRHRMTSLV